jgi:hypothetical protein
VKSSDWAVGKTTWNATFVGSTDGLGENRWCPEHAARCTTAAAAKGKPLDCAPTQKEACGCTPGAVCEDPQAMCDVGLLTSVTLAERTKSPTACCYRLPEHCIAPWMGRVLRDGAGARIVLADADPQVHAIYTESAAAFAFDVAATELALAGAPSELVASARSAAADEVRHASLLSALEGTVAPAPQAPRSARARPLADLAVETFFDACCAETLGALEVRARAEASDDPRRAVVLHSIADDEERHAELAWGTLRWLVLTGGDDVRRALAPAVAQAAADPLIADCLAAALAA